MKPLKDWQPVWLNADKRKIVYGLVGSLLLCLWGFVGFWSWREHQTIIAANRVELEQLTSAVQEQTKSLFKQAETSLVVASHWMAEHPNADPGHAPAFIDLVERLRKTSDGLLDIRMVTRQGVLRYIPDRGQTNNTNVSDRDYFQAQSDPKTRGYFIAKPVLSRVTGKWGIPISIPVDKAGGDIAVLFVAIELDRIAGIFEAERLKPNGTIGILRQDGTIMFRSPMNGTVLGTSVAQSSLWKQLQGISPKGSFQTEASPVDGRARNASFTKVTDYPLIVNVTADMNDLLAAWRVHTAVLMMITVVVSAFCVALGSVLVRAMASEKEVQAQLKAVNEKLEERVVERTVELESALQKLEDSQQSLANSEARATMSTLIAGLSHELSTPLSNSMLATSTIAEGTREFQNLMTTVGLKRSDMTSYVGLVDQGAGMVESNLQRANDLLKNFRQVAADQASEQRRSFDLAQVLQEIVHTLGPSLKRYPEHRVVLDIAPGIVMDSLPGPLGQIVINLINNAYIHAFDGVAQGVLTIQAQADGEWVDLRVRDNGIGIPPENLGKLFQSFFSTKIGKGGTGLGLAIVKNLVTKTLCGSVDVQSTVGKGTEFRIRLHQTLPVTVDVS